MSEDEKSDIETKYDLIIALSSGSRTREFRSMPRRPMSYEEIQSIEKKYSTPDRDCEAWIIKMLDMGIGEESIFMGGEELDESEAVMQFALLTDGNWMPFAFEEGAWYRRDTIPHPDDIDLDAELEMGSMKRVEEALHED